MPARSTPCDRRRGGSTTQASWVYGEGSRFDQATKVVRQWELASPRNQSRKIVDGRLQTKQLDTANHRGAGEVQCARAYAAAPVGACGSQRNGIRRASPHARIGRVAARRSFRRSLRDRIGGRVRSDAGRVARRSGPVVRHIAHGCGIRRISQAAVARCLDGCRRSIATGIGVADERGCVDAATALGAVRRRTRAAHAAILAGLDASSPSSERDFELLRKTGQGCADDEKKEAPRSRHSQKLLFRAHVRSSNLRLRLWRHEGAVRQLGKKTMQCLSSSSQ